MSKVKKAWHKVHKFIYTKILPFETFPILLFLFVPPLILMFLMDREIKSGCQVYFCSHPEIVNNFSKFFWTIFYPLKFLMPIFGNHEIINTLLLFTYTVLLSRVISWIIYRKLLRKGTFYPENRADKSKLLLYFILVLTFFASIIIYLAGLFLYPKFIYTVSSTIVIQIAGFQLAAVSMVFSVFKPKNKSEHIEKSNIIFLALLGIVFSISYFFLYNVYEKQVEWNIINEDEKVQLEATYSACFTIISLSLVSQVFLMFDSLTGFLKKLLRPS